MQFKTHVRVNTPTKLSWSVMICFVYLCSALCHGLAEGLSGMVAACLLTHKQSDKCPAELLHEIVWDEIGSKIDASQGTFFFSKNRRISVVSWFLVI